MGRQAAENRDEAARAGRGPARAGESAGAEAGPESLEPRVVRLEVGFADLKSHFERSEERWEKWRREDQQRHLEHRKELRKELAVHREEQSKELAAHREVQSKELAAHKEEQRRELAAHKEVQRKELAAHKEVQRKELAEFKQEVAANFRRVDGKFEAMGQEIAASARRTDEKLAALKEEIGQLDQRFIRRLEWAVAVILAAILGSGIFG